MKKVFVIILNWNRKKDTLECVKSCMKLDSNGFEINIVVVDNASEDGSISALRKVKGIILIENKRNLGFAEGNNVGIKHALKQGGDYILILNNDTVLKKDLLVQLIKSADFHTGGGSFSPKIYFARGYEFHKSRYKKSQLGKVIWAAGGEVDWDNVYGKNRGVDEVDEGQYEKTKEVDFGSGACVMYRSEALRKCGLYNARYFTYYEDVELAIRMRRKKWKSYYVPKAVLWHKVSQSSGIGSDLNDYFITRNRLIFGMKYASLRAKFALFREAIRFFLRGRLWQRTAVVDYMIGNLYKGSWR